MHEQTSNLSCRRFAGRTGGFTLLELIAVLMILSFLAVVAISRFVDLDANAKSRAIDAAVSELNGREGVVWAEVKFSDGGYDTATGDNDVWTAMRNDGSSSYPELGHYYQWTDGPTAVGGRLSFNGSDGTQLVRNSSTVSRPARWSR
jgi:prepilin-type N-terminal cleavage/methylation domain-containing protein